MKNKMENKYKMVAWSLIGLLATFLYILIEHYVL